MAIEQKPHDRLQQMQQLKQQAAEGGGAERSTSAES